MACIKRWQEFMNLELISFVSTMYKEIHLHLLPGFDSVFQKKRMVFLKLIMINIGRRWH